MPVSPTSIFNFVAFEPAPPLGPLAGLLPWLARWSASEMMRSISQLWLLATTFVVMAVVNAALYARFASAAHRFLASSRARRGFHLGGGSLLAGAGIWTLLLRRPV